MSDDIRVVVILTDANPELLAEFANVSPRARAERMRVLATLGLGFSRGGLVSPVMSQAKVKAEATTPIPQPSLPKFEVRRSQGTPSSDESVAEFTPAVQLLGRHHRGVMSPPLTDGESSASGKLRNPTLARFVKSLG